MVGADQTLFDPVSHDPDLPDETAGGNFNLQAVVYNYAQPTLVDATVTTSVGSPPTIVPLSGPTAETLTQNGNNWTLDFGTIAQGSTGYFGNIVGENLAATGTLSDVLSGTIEDGSGSGFVYVGYLRARRWKRLRGSFLNLATFL